MQNFQFQIEPPKNVARRSAGLGFALRFWLGWLLLLAVLAGATHAYFEYRNQELDKRLEKLREQ